MTLSGVHEDTPLVILAVTDRYPVGDVEEDAFRSALHPKPFKLIPCPLDISKPLSDIPLEITSQVDGLLLLRHYLGKNELTRFPKLKCVVRTGVGYDRVDRQALAAAGVTLHNVPDYGTAEIADHTIALALSLRRGIILHHDAQRGPNPGWSPLDGPVNGEAQLIQRCKGRIWAIIGLGRIGTAVALRAKVFGFNVIFYDPFLANGIDKALDITRVRTIDEAFQTADIISIHCPHTPQTKRIVDSRLLSLVKPGSILVNTARGELVDLEALYDALKAGNLTGAGLDVVQVEPPVEPLPRLIKAYRSQEAWLAGRVVITPHVAFYSKESVDDMRQKSATTMRDVLFDGLMTNHIDPDHW